MTFSAAVVEFLVTAKGHPDHGTSGNLREPVVLAYDSPVEHGVFSMESSRKGIEQQISNMFEPTSQVQQCVTRPSEFWKLHMFVVSGFCRAMYLVGISMLHRAHHRLQITWSWTTGSYGLHLGRVNTSQAPPRRFFSWKWPIYRWFSQLETSIYGWVFPWLC